MNYIVHRGSELKSVLHLGTTYRLTVGGLARVMQHIIKVHPPKIWPTTGLVTLKDLKRGIRVMNKVADLGTTQVTISYQEAYDALVACAYLSNLSAELTPRLNSMLGEAVMIFADCSAVNLRVAYVMPFDSLDAELQKIPVIVRHYRAIGAKASLALEDYPISLTDALDFLEAIKGIRTIKIELLRQALQAATAGIRKVLANVAGR
jgi:hypothetical protein